MSKVRRRFTTARDAMTDIAAAIGEGRDAGIAEQYDVGAIFEAAFEYDPALGHIQDAGFVQVASEAQFWELVAAHRRNLSAKVGDRVTWWDDRQRRHLTGRVRQAWITARGTEAYNVEQKYNRAGTWFTVSQIVTADKLKPDDGYGRAEGVLF